MECTRCGSLIGPTDSACSVCGTAVLPEAPARLGDPPAASPSTTAVPAAAAPANPWAVPPPGSEWGIPQDPSYPTHQPAAQPYFYDQRLRAQAGNGYSITAIVCGVAALIFCPLVLGLTGLALSHKARKRGESMADTARLVSIVGLVGGIVIGFWVVSRM